MTAYEIKSLPKEFDFKSTFNPGCIYHAREREHDYIITTNGCEWTDDKRDFYYHLFNDTYIVIEKELKLYRVEYETWDTFFSETYNYEMLSIGRNEEEAIERVKSVVAKDARGFSAKEITKVFDHAITIERRDEFRRNSNE